MGIGAQIDSPVWDLAMRDLLPFWKVIWRDPRGDIENWNLNNDQQQLHMHNVVTLCNISTTVEQETSYLGNY